MKLLFIRTPFRCFWGGTPAYPLSLGLLSAYLRERIKDVELETIDFEFMDVFRHSTQKRERLSLFRNYLISEYPRMMACQRYWESVHVEESPIWKDMCEKILECSPDMVAIQCYTVNMTSVKRLCDQLKHRNSRLKIVLGGPHITLRAEETISTLSSVDYCLDANAFESLHQLVLIEKNGVPERLRDLPGIWFREKGRPRKGLGTPSPVDIENLPFAERFLGQPADYAPMQPVFTSLGCPWRCAYCSAHRIHNGQVFFRSMKSVVAELRKLKEQGFKDFRITDDTFTFSKKRVVEFVERVNAAGLSDLSFSFGARVDTIDRELMDILSGLNVSYISLGVEAGTNRVLQETMAKKVNVQNTIQAFDLLHQYRFRTWAFFILGNPGESIEEMTATYDLVARIKPSEALVTVASPLPETDYDTYARKEKGLVFTIDNYYKLTSWSPFNHNISAASDGALDGVYQKFRRRMLVIQNKDRARRWVRLMVVNPKLIVSFIVRKVRFFSRFER